MSYKLNLKRPYEKMTGMITIKILYVQQKKITSKEHVNYKLCWIRKSYHFIKYNFCTKSQELYLD